MEETTAGAELRGESVTPIGLDVEWLDVGDLPIGLADKRESGGLNESVIVLSYCFFHEKFVTMSRNLGSGKTYHIA